MLLAQNIVNNHMSSGKNIREKNWACWNLVAEIIKPGV